LWSRRKNKVDEKMNEWTSAKRLVAMLAMIAIPAIPDIAQTVHRESSPGTASSASLSGFWELHFDSRNVPPATLTTQAAALDPLAQYKRDLSEIRWCHFFGVPYVMESSPLDILQNLNGKEIVIATSLRNPARHIYTDGRGHVNPDVFDPASNGHSVGHWEADTLVVDTIGFSSEGPTRIPGGGYRTPTSHLVERYKLIASGSQLSVVSTWEDPAVFAKPHTYEFHYYRAPKGTEAREFDCKANDEVRAKYLSPE
jgi:hypothetical protein